jgi:hypothetical protein
LETGRAGILTIEGGIHLKPVKFLFVAFLFMIGILLNSELFQDYLLHFETPLPYMTFMLPQHIDQIEMIDDFYTTAQANSLSLLVPVRTEHTAFSSTLDIYYIGDEIPDLLRGKFNLNETTYSSFFSGEVTVCFDEFREIPDITLAEKYMFVGDEESLQIFKSEMLAKYGGNMPFNPGYEKTDDQNMLYGIFVLIGGTLLLLTYYEILQLRKEVLVRISMGERRSVLILKNAITDTLVLGSIFFTVIFSFLPFTNTLYQIKLSLTSFSVITLLNALLYLLLCGKNVRRAFANSGYVKSLLSASVGLKSVSLVITTIAIGANIVSIEQAIRYRLQEGFFKEREDYYYVDLLFKADSFDPADVDEAYYKTRIMYEEIYRKFYHTGNIQIYSSVYGNAEGNNEGIYLNKNTKEYLLKAVPELRNFALDEGKIYFIFPQNMYDEMTRENGNNIESTLAHMLRNFGEILYDFDYETYVYQDDSDIIVLGGGNSSSYTSYYERNPILMLNNMDERNTTYSMESERGGSFSLRPYIGAMYKVDAEEVLTFAEQFGFNRDVDKWRITNVYEKYLYHWNIMKRLLTISVILTLLMLLLEIMLIIVIIRLQYSVNAIELSVKKVLGYSLWERTKGMLMLTLITGILSGIATTVANYHLRIANSILLICAYMVIIVIETAIVLLYARKHERHHITKILKGGIS